jgi:hypothetical protein
MPAPPIEQKIQLVGDAEVQRQLATLGIGGAASIKKLEDATRSSAAGFDLFGSTAARLGSSIDALRGGAGGLGSAFEGLGSSLTALVPGFAAL